jgi:hypothetical protein
MTPKKPEWFELSEGDSASTGIRRVDKKLPLAALVATGAIILAGSIFANANDEPTAVADTTSVTQSSGNSNADSVAGTSSSGTSAQTNNSKSAPAPIAVNGKSSNGVNSLPMPTVSNVPQRGGHEEHEGREHHEGGEHEGREHHEGGEHEGREHDDD